MAVFFPNDTVCVNGICLSKSVVNLTPIEQMKGFFSGMFSTANWPERWYCGSWNGFQGWSFVIADTITFLSYFGIPIFLIYFSLKRSTESWPFKNLLLLFSFFIMSCGITHLLDAVMFWKPVYNFLVFTKILTAAISFATLMASIIESGRLLSLKSPSELKRIVEERTNALRSTNKLLIDEIVRRKASEHDLQTQLELNEKMFREMHHRIKNNLQVILNMLFLKTRDLDDNTRKLLKPLEQRISSISRLHDKLLQSNNSMKVNLRKLTVDILDSQIPNENIAVDTAIEIPGDVELDSETALHFGLILSEAYTNSNKHAFSESGKNVFKVAYHTETGKFTIADNGKGMGSSHESSESFGMGLIQTFVKAMGASLSIDSGEHGTVLHIIPDIH